MTKIYQSEEQVAQCLAAFEIETDAYAISVENISLWQLLRPSLGFRLLGLDFKKPVHSKKKVFIASLRGLRFWGLFKKNKYLVQTFYSGLRVKVGDKFQDVWFDSILQSIPGGCKVIRMNANGFEKNLKNAFIKPDYDSTLLSSMSGLLAILFPIQPGDSSYERVAGLANRLLGETEYTQKKIQRFFSKFMWQSRLNSILLKLSGCSYCLAVGTAEFPMIHACQKEGIRYIELQHGIFTKDNPYSLPQCALKHRANLLMPYRIGLYGEFWKENLKTTAQSSLGVLVNLGNPIAEKYRLQRKRDFKIDSRFKILVTTQGLEREVLIQFFSSFLNEYEGEITIYFKLHPAYDPDPKVYSSLYNYGDRIVVCGGSEGESTYSLLSICHLHLSISSACHYDALAIGIPTGVLQMRGYELMEPVINSGEARLLKNTPDLIDWIAEIKTSCDFVSTQSSKFSSPGFEDNLRRLMFHE